MCGRYVLVSKLIAIEKQFNLNSSEIELTANPNIAPGDYAPIIRSDDPKTLNLARFGFTPL